MTDNLSTRLQDCTRALNAGKPVVVTDAVRDIGVAGLAGASTSAVNMNFLIKDCRGIIYAGLPASRLAQMDIGRQVGGDVFRSQVHVAVDAIEGVTTGVSAADRAATVHALIDPTTKRNELRSPGHVLPTGVDESGAMSHFNLAEALAHLTARAGMGQGIALSGVLAADGSMANCEQLENFARVHDSPLIDVADVVRARRLAEGWSGPRPDSWTTTLVHLRLGIAVHALGAYQSHETFPVTVLPYCPTGQLVRGSCGCGHLLSQALDHLERSGIGAVAVSWSAPAAEHETVCTGHEESSAIGLEQLLAADLAGASATTPLAFAISKGI